MGLESKRCKLFNKFRSRLKLEQGTWIDRKVATLQTDHVYFTLKRRGEQPFPRRFS